MITTAVTIRKAASFDAGPLHAVETAAFDDTVYPTFFFRQAFDLWPDLLHVAEGARGILGYAMGATTVDPDVAWLLSMAVHPHTRGKGVGSALLASLLDTMRRKEFKFVRLTVEPASPARRLYETSQFHEVHAEENYFQPGDSRIVMQRILE